MHTMPVSTASVAEKPHYLALFGSVQLKDKVSAICLMQILPEVATNAFRRCGLIAK
jgi:hypothetical protein